MCRIQTWPLCNQQWRLAPHVLDMVETPIKINGGEQWWSLFPHVICLRFGRQGHTHMLTAASSLHILWFLSWVSTLYSRYMVTEYYKLWRTHQKENNTKWNPYWNRNIPTVWFMIFVIRMTTIRSTKGSKCIC